VWLDNADEIVNEPIVVDSVQAIQEIGASFENFVVEKQNKDADFHALGNAARDCQAQGVAENTYSEVSFATLENLYNNIAGQIDARRSAIANEQAKQEANEQLRLEFANHANDFHSWLKSKNSAIESLSGEIQAQLNALNDISNDLSPGKAQYDQLVSLTHKLDAAEVSDNQHTPHTIEGLKSQWNALNVLLTKKQQILEKELLAQSGTGLSASQLAEFKECFKHFDKDEDNLLNRLELGACLKSLGEDINFDAGGKLDQIINGIDGDADGKVTFEEFVSYMERVSLGSDTPDSIKQAFRTLAGDKDYVTEADLRSVLPAEKVAYCVQRMQPYPAVAGAFDYNTFTDSLYKWII